MSLRAGVVLGLGLLAAGPVQAQSITEFPISTPDAVGIVAGPDGNLWFGEFSTGKVGRITTAGVPTDFPAAGLPGFICVGSDGNLWFTEGDVNKIGRMTTAGAFQDFPIITSTSGVVGIAPGSDGNLWFVLSNANKIGRITTAGTVTEFPIPTPGVPLQIAAGPDGNLWFTEFTAGKVGRITPAGVITEFPVPEAGSQPQGITAGPDGNIWFTDTGTNKIGRMTTTGAVTEFPILTAGANLLGITKGPDDNLWFALAAQNRIGRITPSGVVTEFVIPTAGSEPVAITAGPDGNLWFNEVGEVGRITLSSLIAQPASVDGHAAAGTSSNVNGVLEPGETVEVSPSWENTRGSAQSPTGVATSLAGPAGPSYAIDDSSASYGSIPGGATANCHDATGNCYRVTVAGARPVPHWDAVLSEDLSVDATKWARTIHVGNSFPDVPTTHPFYAFIENLFHSGATGGCGLGNYCPGGTVTRAQMAVFLLKGKLGSSHMPPPATGTVFADVPVGSFAADWIEELAALGITGGCGGGNYCPGNPVTRAQMAVFLLKSEHGAAYVPPNCAGIFDDVPCPSQFANWVEQLAAEGITAGCGGNNFCPDDPNIRGQMAVFLVKIFGMELYPPA